MGDLIQSIASMDPWAYWSIVLALAGVAFLVLCVGFLLAKDAAGNGGVE